MKTKKKISQIAKVISGYTFRTSIENNPEGNISVIQIKDILKDGMLDIKNLTKINEEIKQNHLLGDNDVILKSKGINNRAFYIGKPDVPTIATSQFLVVKDICTEVMSEYLVWYINQPESQLYFEVNAAGITVPNIKKQTLEDFDVIIPTLDVQHDIIKMNKLKEQEKQLLEAITEKKQLLLNAVMKKMINK